MKPPLHEYLHLTYDEAGQETVFRAVALVTFLFAVATAVICAANGQVLLASLTWALFVLPLTAIVLALRWFTVQRLSPISIFIIITMLISIRLVSAPTYAEDLIFVPLMITVAYFLLPPRLALIASVYQVAGMAAAAAVVLYFQPFPILQTNDSQSANIWIAAVGCFAGAMWLHRGYINRIVRLVVGLRMQRRELENVSADYRILLNGLMRDLQENMLVVGDSLHGMATVPPGETETQMLRSGLNASMQIDKLIADVRLLRHSIGLEGTGRFNLSLRQIFNGIRMFHDSESENRLEVAACEDDTICVNVMPMEFTFFVVNILLDQALNMAKPESPISIATEIQNKHVVLTINFIASGFPRSAHSILGSESPSLSDDLERLDEIDLHIAKDSAKKMSILSDISVVPIANGFATQLSLTIPKAPT